MVHLKHVPYKGDIINIWEIVHMYKHKATNKLINEQNTQHA